MPSETNADSSTINQPPRPVKRLSQSKLKPTAKIPTDLNALIDKNDEADEDTAKDDEGDFYGNDPFTFEQLQKHWKDFAALKKSEGKDAEHMVLQQDIYLKELTTVVIKLTNAVKIDILDRFRSDLVTHLKSKLNNGKLVLEIELVKEEAKRMIYTNKEKFDYLAEKKPILKQLKDRLGLDPDF
ncbi:DNA polymerase III subunit gamma/tau [Fulvivirga imtechensis AK7]|uniref:DNA polymerase III subunit gamma/tau n=1 Tax=Fulvivirga imtechensis AK7 TaxID=1237149 RepID=L8JGM4_9BACT|nr:hypothetical protein [Fulvivirga imtechensis]ELR68026.1 DNA polymerase III subunit gamma/tau [Fulvivirga imtechensis AK7]